MHPPLLFGILALILPSSLSVHPGDPFPTDQSKSKPITSEDLINANEITDPKEDIAASSKSLADPNSDEENSMDSLISTSTKSMLIANKPRYKYVGRKNNLKAKLPLPITKLASKPNHHADLLENNSSLSRNSSMLSPLKPIGRNNLIKIGRWKYVDLRSKTIRYWYEPEGGHMGTDWTFDGFIFEAYNKSEFDTEPVYAFHSDIRSIWTNTVQMDPKPPIIGNDQWIPDGVSFYAYRTSMNSNELQPVLRYWNKLKPGASDATETRITYLTMKETESNDKEEEFGWIYNDKLFYALPIEDKI